MSGRLVILDGHGIIFRAYFAVREPLVILVRLLRLFMGLLILSYGRLPS